ncbi:hypothetical protein DYB37_007875 [Aphanomyces astaci]|uniref:Diphthamide biosynthesis protein 3 n=1 Tax=Aphanomyces astaci TaxID=112090 RepID=A0A397CJT4_APHAT|nr:hypothetical protein DYB25_012215 [Aphanomyces astaci]RHY44811.1 hypothetical protein DYB30_004598 [Aphanomyces astaci]RHY45659.1 hypothetical protein DYB38_007647 [Aphanomyces astaci]RHY56142.1 hypothetical protein DYB34_007816 [Aphanomyces astaci]RHY85223.1 hypothetical protein DYB31_011259 [Aphanomyces astaci]
MSVYDEIEIEDMEYNEKEQLYTYPCPCGDNFFITLQDLYDGDDIGSCPSCSLTIRVIFDEDNLPELRDDDEDDDEAVDDLVKATEEHLTVTAVLP